MKHHSTIPCRPCGGVGKHPKVAITNPGVPHKEFMVPERDCTTCNGTGREAMYLIRRSTLDEIMDGLNELYAMQVGENPHPYHVEKYQWLADLLAELKKELEQ